MSTLSDLPPYSMVLEWDPRDSIFVVTVPEFERCHTHGRDYEEAVRHGQDAIEVSVGLDRALGLVLPEPRIFDNQGSDLWNADTTAVADDTSDDQYPPYSMVLEWDPRSDIFIATLPEFRGAHTHGETYERAARMGREVIEMLVDIAREDGEPLPAIRIFRPRRVEAVA